MTENDGLRTILLAFMHTNVLKTLLFFEFSKEKPLGFAYDCRDK